MVIFQICKLCLSYMRTHPELIGWLKCGSCGYSHTVLGVSKMSIDLKTYLMGREKQYPNDYTKNIEENAIALLKKVNALLFELNISLVKISSGWRPPSINVAVPNAAKNSSHQTANAVDILDIDRSFARICLNNLDKLQKYGLYMENPCWTKGIHTNWVHLQQIKPGSGHRIFIPSTAPAIDPDFFDGNYNHQYDS